MRRKVLFIAIFFFLGLGVFYGADKFNVPWYGNNDFTQYYLMVEKPFDNRAIAPSAYRVATPTIVHYVHKYGLYHDSLKRPFRDIFFKYNGNTYDPNVLSAFIFTNFIFFVLSAFFLSESMLGLVGNNDPELSLIAIFVSSMVFLSLPTVIHGMAGLTEGGTNFIVSLLLYLYLRKRFLLFSLVVLLSISQRELIPLIIGVYISAVIYFEGKELKGFAEYRYVFISLIAFGIYMVVRWTLPIRGYEQQIQASHFLSSMLEFRPSVRFFVQGFVAYNLAWTVLLIVVCLYKDKIKFFMPFIAVACFLMLLSVGEHVSNDLSRIFNMATPLLLFSFYSSIIPPVALQDSCGSLDIFNNRQ